LPRFNLPTGMGQSVKRRFLALGKFLISWHAAWDSAPSLEDMMLFRLIALFGILLATPAAASNLTGTWDLQVTGGVLFRIEVRQASSGFDGTWLRPETFHHIDDAIFFDVTGPAVTRAARQVREIDGDLELTFDSETAGGRAVILLLHQRDPNSVELRYVASHFAPFVLVRSSGGDPIGPWDPKISYAATRSHDSNAEMTALFVADQNDRKGDIDWSVVAAADVKRLERTQKILESGGLHTGSDFNYAAFIFQHGKKPDAYLKAHLLAMVAVARGRPDALWIASASLDRYLQQIGQSQVLGTQLSGSSGRPVEPYDRSLIPETMRTALGLPTLAEQEAQWKDREANSVSTASQKK